MLLLCFLTVVKHNKTHEHEYDVCLCVSCACIRTFFTVIFPVCGTKGVRIIVSGMKILSMLSICAYNSISSQLK